jgi:hypothetical protein
MVPVATPTGAGVCDSLAESETVAVADVDFDDEGGGVRLWEMETRAAVAEDVGAGDCVGLCDGAPL